MKPIFTFKKITAFVLGTAMLFAFTACGGANAPSTEPSTAAPATRPVIIDPDLTSTATPAGTTAETTEATTPETTEATTIETTEATTPETTENVTQENTVVTTPETTEQTQEQTSGNQGGSDSYEITDLEGAVPESGKADASYFDDVVFVGDSVSLKLSYYEAAVDLLGKAQFLTSGSLGSGNALWKVSDASVHPTYKGEKMRIEDAIGRMGAKKVYIMLGMNDIAIFGVDRTVENLTTLIDLILEQSPDSKIYIQTMTPITSTSVLYSSTGHNPATIHAYNKALLSLCQARGFYLIDVASVMYDSNGFLKREYCSDPDGMGIHFTNAGCGAWVDYLYTHTAG